MRRVTVQLVMRHVRAPLVHMHAREALLLGKVLRPPPRQHVGWFRRGFHGAWGMLVQPGRQRTHGGYVQPCEQEARGQAAPAAHPAPLSDPRTPCLAVTFSVVTC